MYVSGAKHLHIFMSTQGITFVVHKLRCPRKCVLGCTVLNHKLNKQKNIASTNGRRAMSEKCAARGSCMEPIRT